MNIIIAGGGIGGLTAALHLHRAGHAVTVYEQVSEIRALGVGINLLPHAVGILAEFGLEPALAATAIATKEYVFMNRHGQQILADARGTSAGYAHPQFSIHRGELQMILYEAAKRAIGAERIRTGMRLGSFSDDGKQVRATFVDREGNPQAEVGADLLIACDGIHSVVRAKFYPDEGMPIWNGVTMWRGVTEGMPFLSGGSIVKAGAGDQKFIVYPISKKLADEGRALINWICDLRVPGKTLLTREDWNRPGKLEDFLPEFENWKFPFLDVPEVIRRASAIYEFPMVDRDPLPRWSFGRITLLGDAAHPMYPISSNGASQAILDAQALTSSLGAIADPVAALADYEAKRLPPTAEIVRMNRQRGPDVILDIIEERAPHGFANIEDVIPHAELEQILSGYKRAAGHQQKASGAARPGT